MRPKRQRAPSDPRWDMASDLQPPSNRTRVKVYELKENDWFDRGTGFCTGQIIEDEPRIFVESEDKPLRILLETKISKDGRYQKQQDTLIVWTEPNQTDMALNFQEVEGCALIWNFVQQYLLTLAAADDALSDDLEHIQPVLLPAAELANLPEIDHIMRAASITQAGRDALSKCVIRDEYIHKLLLLVTVAEDLESHTDLHRLCNIMESLILLNDTTIIETIVTDPAILGVVGALEELQVEVMETMKRVLGPEHPSTLTVMGSLAATYQKQGQLKEAQGLQVQATEVMKRVLGPEHPSTLASMDKLASILMCQGRANEAENISQVRKLDHSQTQAPPAKAASVSEDQESSTRPTESIFEGTTLVETQAELIFETKSLLPFDQKASDTTEDEDCTSVESNDADIASQVAKERTEPEILAVRYLGSFLADLKQLRPLHEEALKKLGVKRFRENYRRILKYYVLKLRPEAYSAIEKDIVRVLKSRLNRISIAERILSLIQEEKENNVKPLDELISRPVEKQSLEAWASNAYGEAAADATFDPEIEGYGQSDDEDENEDAEDDDCLQELTVP
ncbi:hypothetical protein BDW69DRAFT_189826 [Aspergillus filifer]